MYKVNFCIKDSFFEEYGAEQEKLISKEELIAMLQDVKVIVISAYYIAK